MIFNYNDFLRWKARFSSFRIKGAKNKFLASFVVIVVVLAFVRLIFPSVAEDRTKEAMLANEVRKSVDDKTDDTAALHVPVSIKPVNAATGFPLPSCFEWQGQYC